METLEVLIGIQARSNSTRFPKKIYELVDGKRILDHVIDRSKSAANHVMRVAKGRSLRCTVAVLHPENDTELVNAFKSSGCNLVSGPEQDVLSRYVSAQRLYDADYVVRITSDCPLILDYVIVKHINSATYQRLDYVENVDESCRTSADGFDCEIISKRALKWLDENAIGDDREHVTTLLRKRRPKDLTYGHVRFKHDTSALKLSVDTPEDLEFIRKYIHDSDYKRKTAEKIVGRGNVFEL